MPREISGHFYATAIEVCANCMTAWEPFDPADLLDAGDISSSFREPCDNCAFRAGSVEQRDGERWAELMDKLKQDDGRFYCHKGLPLDPGGEHGFAYPVSKPRKMRLCRGFLRMWGARVDKEAQ